MKSRKLFFLLFTISCFQLFAQNKEEVIKTGYTFGLLPTISYNSDLGFQYGGL